MRYLLSWIVLISWGLWMGGQATLVLLIMSLFVRDRPVAIQAGPHLFHVFERYQLIVAGIAIVAALALWLVTRKKIFVPILACFILAAAGGVISMTSVTAKMEALWSSGESSSPAFYELHQKSRILYTSESALLLIASLMIPCAITTPRAARDQPPRPTPSD
jgi:hypothetical protein